MPGVRIYHPTARNAVYTIVDGTRPYGGATPEPYECSTCHRTHVFKTYHVTVDDTGHSIVSERVLERLNAVPGGHPFSVVNEVAQPPTLRIGGNGLYLPIIEHPEVRHA